MRLPAWCVSFFLFKEKAIMKSSTSLKIYKVLLVTLITSLSITGISYLDDKNWNIVLLVIGMTTYSIVGFLFSIGLLHGKNAGKEAYGAIFIILLLLGYGVYCGIVNLQIWILSWALWIKITVPVILIAIIVIAIVLIVKSSHSKNKVVDPKEKENSENETN